MARRPGRDGYSLAQYGGGGNRAPTEIAPLFPRCDYELGCKKEAKRKIYNVSCERYFGFGCEINEETSNKLEGLPGVLFVLPDSYVDTEYKDYGGKQDKSSGSWSSGIGSFQQALVTSACLIKRRIHLDAAGLLLLRAGSPYSNSGSQ
ncbi:unnamed protein product [Urochloa humidicola]